jgi:hypothetical protein
MSNNRSSSPFCCCSFSFCSRRSTSASSALKAC